MEDSRGRILIVDDEANARAALSEILREEGYETETAADGFKALGKLGAFSPDLILTDLKMPGLDGLGLLKEARAASNKWARGCGRYGPATASRPLVPSAPLMPARDWSQRHHCSSFPLRSTTRPLPPRCSR